MKRGDKVRVIASKPVFSFEYEIEALIGRDFVVTKYDKESQRVSIDAGQTHFNGQITLNPGEYQEL